MKEILWNIRHIFQTNRAFYYPGTRRFNTLQEVHGVVIQNIMYSFFTHIEKIIKDTE
jgi:hypothetical protein